MQALPQGFFPNYPLAIDPLQIFLWVLLGITLGAAIYYLYHYWKKRPVAIAPLVVPPRDLRKLWQETCAAFNQDAPDIKKYFIETSTVLRSTLEILTGQAIAELTVSELAQLRQPLKGQADLLVALRIADLVKFAKYIPQQSETETYRESALRCLAVYEPKEQLV